MRKLIQLTFLVLLLFSIPFGMDAHPVFDYPEGGEELQPGSSVTLKWHIAIEHEQEDWDLYFSPDGGETWEVIEEDMRISTLEYTWVVPEISTNNAQLRIVMDNVEGIADYEDVVSFSIDGGTTITGIYDKEENDNIISLANYPNPFRSFTNITFTVQSPSFVNMAVYNIRGEKVATLINDELDSGEYTYYWKPEHISSGLYICNLRYGDLKKSLKMVLLQ